MAEAKLFSHVGQQLILGDEDQFLVHMLKGLNLMVHLNKYRLRRHLPVHSVGLIRTLSLVAARDAKPLKEALSLRPDGSRSVKGLELDADKISNAPVSNGHKKIVDATSGDRNFRNDVQFVTRLVSCKQVQTINENLTTLG